MSLKSTSGFVNVQIFMRLLSKQSKFKLFFTELSVELSILYTQKSYYCK